MSITLLRKPSRQPLPAADKQSNRALAKLHIRLEHSIRRLKQFRIFAERYRNRRKRFGLRLHLLAGILNYEMGLAI
ncbi:MAG: transposase family protein [Leptolyngbya sp. SIO1D8]|nr:transposase family protein [Leptolyngbya sp. SIO1D8]